MRLVGTTKTTIASVRDRTHWNASTLTPMDPVTLGLCSQIELDFEVQRAAKEKPADAAYGGATLLPASETTRKEPEFEPTEKQRDDLNVDAVFAKLKTIGRHLSKSSPRKRGPIRRGGAFWHDDRRLLAPTDADGYGSSRSRGRHIVWRARAQRITSDTVFKQRIICKHSIAISPHLARIGDAKHRRSNLGRRPEAAYAALPARRKD